MGPARQTGLKRRRLRAPAARARARQLAALRQWLRQRVAMLAIVFMLFAPFGLIGVVSGIQVVFGAPPTIMAGRAGFSYTENDVTIIDPGILVTYDTPATETRQIIAEFVAATHPNNPTSTRMFVKSGTGLITVTGSGTCRSCTTASRSAPCQSPGARAASVVGHWW